MNRRNRKRAISLPLETVSCAAIVEQGEIVCQHVGTPSVDFGDDPIYVYQKGLLPPKAVSRCHRSLLSNFKIATSGGSVHVPWSHFAHIPTPEKRILDSKRGETHTRRFITILEKLTYENILVVWVHGNYGERMFEWYIAFKCNREGSSTVLTRVPHQYFTKIITNSGVSPFCSCCECRNHPLLRMTNTCTTHSASVFESYAVKYFQEYANLVYKFRDEHQNQHKKVKLVDSTSTPASLTFVEAGTCAICLEDTQVSSSTCSHNTCKLQVCSDCHAKTRGLCAVCDRSKNSCAFLCMTCDNLCDMDDYGYKCLRCDNPRLCKSCYQNFEFCVHCACDITSSKGNVKKA